MGGQSAAIAGLASCAASAALASKSFFIVSSYAETNGGCEQKLLMVSPLLRDQRHHILYSRSFTVAPRPQLPGICRALASDSRPALFGQQGLCEMWPTISNPNFDTPVRLRVGRNKALCHPRLETALRLSQHHGAGRKLSGAGSSKACFRIQRPRRRPTSAQCSFPARFL